MHQNFLFLYENTKSKETDIMPNQVVFKVFTLSQQESCHPRGATSRTTVTCCRSPMLTVCV